tara:strand:+ start:1391 stop:2734 length:1344 start_codon:yes stop_codon:yes gene_type:complete
MSSIRQGYLDDYTQQNQNVGIGTSIPKEKLEIHGGVTSKDLNVTGIATLTSASGFIKRNLEYSENVDLDAGDSATLSDEIIVGTGLTMVVGNGVTAGQGNIDSLKVYKMFQPPSGTTNQRPVAMPGSLFYNFDFKTVEFFDGNSWRQVDNTTTRGRAVISSGSGSETAIDFFNMATEGDALDFGNTSQSRTSSGSSSNEIRGVFGGGYSGGKVNTMDYVTIAAGGDAIDFGDLTTTRNGLGGCSSSTRGLFIGGTAGSSYTNVIEYVELMTLGNAIDFGDLSVASSSFTAASSPTRGITGGGLHNPSSPAETSQIDMIIISSKGNSVDSGDLTSARRESAGASNSIRGVFAGGDDPVVDTIDYVTLASLGNASDFGVLSTNRTNARGVASQRRALFCGGTPSYPAGVDIIEFVEIASTGNARDFGDLTKSKRSVAGVSDSHGGLGGF